MNDDKLEPQGGGGHTNSSMTLSKPNMQARGL